VAGDNKQLPPTGFFAAASEDDNAAANGRDLNCWASRRQSIRVRLAQRSAPWSLRGRLLRGVLRLKTLQGVAILWVMPRWLTSAAVPDLNGR
jgi:hypothetical protein